MISPNDYAEQVNQVENLSKEIYILKHEKDRLSNALIAIIEECPNPKLPYGIRVVEIAKEALEYT